ncbi:MAG: hypothetical protein ABSH29_02125 [Acidimicrobiales bacterium]|jgi:hypothetical protein
MASARTSRSSAVVPFVQAAKHIFNADAAAWSSEITRASTVVSANTSRTGAADGPDRYRRGEPEGVGGGPMMPPST